MFTVMVTLAAIGNVLLSSIATSPNIARAQLNCTAVETFTGNGIKQTPPFEVTSDQWRIRTNFESTAADEGFRTFVIKAYNADDRNFQTFLALEGPGNEPFLVSAGAGRYYLDVRSANATWTITIEECGEPAPPPQPNPPRPNPPEPNPPQANPPVDDKNCENYPTQAAAQAELRRNPEDRFGLDGAIGRSSTGIPGVACEDRPPPKDLTPAPGYGEQPQPPRPPEPPKPPHGHPKLPPTGGPPYAEILGVGALALLGAALIVGRDVLKR
jgi:hypothetical protein